VENRTIIQTFNQIAFVITQGYLNTANLISSEFYANK